MTDHPLVSPYEGSELRRKDVKEFDEYNAFTGMDEAGKEPTGIALEGKVTKILYTKPKERSILEVYRNYEMAVQQSGAEILYQCNQEKNECVERYAGPTLDAAALGKGLDAKGYVIVGHTDMQGSLAHNQQLSEARARTVVDDLSSRYGIARDRMSGHGVGPLAPQASNNTESGRAKNRRVVLVARPGE